MKEKEILATYGRGINIADFKRYLQRNRLLYSQSITGSLVVDDYLIEEYIGGYLLEKEENEELEAENRIREEEENARKRKAMANMLITSGFNFDGYTIKKYSGYISGDDAVSVDRGYSWENVSVRDDLLASLSRIRRNALRELKEAAYDLGCNAVIGVDFDYITLDPQTANHTGGTTYQPYVFCVTANGNAVIIEKDED
jgi:uncharacterized protein YbjQ (UPF0145 family)